MSRFLASLQRTTFSARPFHWTPAFRVPEVKKYNPKDWKIIETSPSGLERTFVNKKTGQSTWYTPEGMSAAEILAIPNAKKYWSTIEEAEEYIKVMAEEKVKYGSKDITDED